ncbi:unnamed protein product [Owenia fusiformis]|uniref:Uncharacterized protein n=1 Tax=Owenia fusiformis TaxID=6347 RepID=A0A8J1UMN2_OWEFU|nr:unnamed protein product [Owenia fusiformis]
MQPNIYEIHECQYRILQITNGKHHPHPKATTQPKNMVKIQDTPHQKANTIPYLTKSTLNNIITKRILRKTNTHRPVHKIKTIKQNITQIRRQNINLTNKLKFHTIPCVRSRNTHS